MSPITGASLKSLPATEKWKILGPFVTKYGRESLAYATLQQGMDYFLHPKGYIAYTVAQHPVFSPRSKPIVLSDPICALEDQEEVISAFMKEHRKAVFAVISEHCGEVLRRLKFKVNTVGYEPELTVPTYQTEGNWKDLDLIKRARNEAKREGITIREVDITQVPRLQLDDLSSRWIAGKKVNDREIWVYARRPVYEHEPDVRKFVAFAKDGTVAGYVFYDPMYRNGAVYGYSANIVRCDERRYGKLATAIHMTAVDTFKSEGKEVLSLLLCPFTKVDAGVFNDDWATKLFFKISERYGNEIYNFKGLSFHKSKYRGTDRMLYFASNGILPSNDVYLAFLTSDIASSYFATMGKLLKGVFKETFKRTPAPPAKATSGTNTPASGTGTKAATSAP